MSKQSDTERKAGMELHEVALRQADDGQLQDLIARLEKDEWRAVLGWPYEASSDGDIRSTRTGRVLVPTVSPKGYARCTFQVDNKRRDVRVHRAVAEAWIGPIPDGMEINHIDGNKLNNRPANLEIVTRLQNEAHAAANGLKATGDRNGTRTRPERVARGSSQGLSKLSAECVLDIRARRANGEPLSAIASRYGVDQSLVSQIARRKIWKHI